MNKKIIAIIIGIVAVGAVLYFSFGRDILRKNKVVQIDLNEDGGAGNLPIANEGPVSPISGLPCENWNRRPLAVMQAADVPARPVAGLSQADMVIEMPVITASITRIMAIYVCNTPPEDGSMRSARHDFVHLAKGMDAIFAHWGRADIESFKEGFNNGMIDNLNCNNDAGRSAQQCCFRKDDMARGVDSGYARPADLLQCAKDFGYRTENDFSGYPHQGEVPMEQRPSSGNIRVGFAGAYGVNYEYDRATNAYKRIWGDVADKDRNTSEQSAPKNVVVLIAQSSQIEGQYNNVQLGDPWYDSNDTGEAFYYFNGTEMRGTWKKDKGNIASKLFFYDSAGKEVAFVPGQIWVEVLEPGQTLKWRVF